MACSGFYNSHLLHGLPRSLLSHGLHGRACSGIRPCSILPTYSSHSCLLFSENTPDSVIVVRLREVGIPALCNTVTSLCSRRRQVYQELQRVEMFPAVLNADNGKCCKMDVPRLAIGSHRGPRAHTGACALTAAYLCYKPTD